MRPSELTAAHLGKTVRIGIQDEDGMYSECVLGVLRSFEHVGGRVARGALPHVMTTVVLALSSGAVEMDLSGAAGQLYAVELA